MRALHHACMLTCMEGLTVGGFEKSRCGRYPLLVCAGETVVCLSIYACLHERRETGDSEQNEKCEVHDERLRERSEYMSAGAEKMRGESTSVRSIESRREHAMVL